MRYETLKAPLESDCTQINALLKQLSKNPPTLTLTDIHSYVLRNDFTMVVARDTQDNIIGMASVSFFEDFPYRAAHVSGVVVDVRFRGMNIGEKLMRILEDIARIEGVRHVWLTSDPDNPKRDAARNLYKKLGYVERGGLFRLTLS